MSQGGTTERSTDEPGASRAVRFGRILRDLREARAGVAKNAQATTFFQAVFDGVVPNTCDDFLARATGGQLGSLLEYVVDPANLDFEGNWHHTCARIAPLLGAWLEVWRAQGALHLTRETILQDFRSGRYFATDLDAGLPGDMRAEKRRLLQHYKPRWEEIEGQFRAAAIRFFSASDEEIVATLRRLADDRTYSLRAVAARAGFSHGYLSQIESGKTLPSESAIYALAEQLDVRPDALFTAAGVTPGDVNLRMANDRKFMSAVLKLAKLTPENFDAAADTIDRQIRDGDW